MALLAVVAVLTTIAGPVLDHHFAERQASHGHVFLYQVQPEHDHLAGDGHAHAEGDTVAASVIATGDGAAAGQTVDNVIPPTAARTGGDAIALQFVGIITDDDPPFGLTGSPLERPPIA